MSEDKKPAPKVFISYSHDNKEHKAWVAQLGARLLNPGGVEVILDQWDAEPGDDLPKFMEKGLAEADRVLMICTESYIRKVNDGKGGAGYEAMIVTSELIQDQGLNKFIPVLRQTTKLRVKPTCLSTRYHVDLSADQDFEEEFKKLLETLHNVARLKKPQRGPNPFEKVDLRSPETKKADLVLTEQFSSELTDPLAAFSTARNLISSGNSANWRKFIQTVERHCSERLINWKNVHGAAFPRNYTENDPLPLITYVAEGTTCYFPLLACLLAAVDSGDPQFSGLLSWVDTVWEPKGWERNGLTVVVEFPRTVLFLLHSTVGAMMMLRGAGTEAFQLATTPIRIPYKKSESSPLFLTSDVTGWTETLQHYCTLGWKFVSHVGENTPWLEQVFGSKEDLQIGRAAYYMLLSFLEFCSMASTLKGDFDPTQWRLGVPLNFCSANDDVLRPAYRLLLDQSELLKKILQQNKIDETRFKELWPLWIKASYSWLTSVYRMSPRFSALPQEKLSKDLFRDIYDLSV